MKRNTFKVRWADVDMNGHLRHSAYADYCTNARVELLEEFGLGMREISKMGIGLILFREELIYKREIAIGEVVTIKTHLSAARQDLSRWSIQHELFKADDILACTVAVDGAWLNLSTRKLGSLPTEFADKILKLPRAEAFRWLD